MMRRRFLQAAAAVLTVGIARPLELEAEVVSVPAITQATELYTGFVRYGSVGCGGVKYFTDVTHERMRELHQIAQKHNPHNHCVEYTSRFPDSGDVFKTPVMKESHDSS